jgi:Fe-S-cluster containining protein
MLCMRLSRGHLHAATTATYEHTAAELGRSRAPATCAAVCRRLNGVIDGELAGALNAGAAVACAPGCDFCCHLRVEVFPHEAAALLEHLQSRTTAAAAAATRERILANALRIDGLTAAEHRAAAIPCALLVDGRCSAHDVRPSACAVYHSLSRERCEHSFRHPEDIGTVRNARPALLELQVMGSALIEATQAGLTAAGLDGEQRELHQALRALLGGGSRS